MTKWNMIKKQTAPNGKVISTGEKTIPLFDNDNKELETRVSKIENQLNTIIDILKKSNNKTN